MGTEPQISQISDEVTLHLISDGRYLGLCKGQKPECDRLAGMLMLCVVPWEMGKLFRLLPICPSEIEIWIPLYYLINAFYQ